MLVSNVYRLREMRRGSYQTQVEQYSVDLVGDISNERLEGLNERDVIRAPLDINLDVACSGVELKLDIIIKLCGVVYLKC